MFPVKWSGKTSELPCSRANPNPSRRWMYLARDLRRVHPGRVEEGGVAPRSEATSTDGARWEPVGDRGVDDRERVVEHRAPLDDPRPLRVQVPQVLREAGLARSGRPEEEYVGPGDERSHDILVRQSPGRTVWGNSARMAAGRSRP